jgi:hypothetical protein
VAPKAMTRRWSWWWLLLFVGGELFMMQQIDYRCWPFSESNVLHHHLPSPVTYNTTNSWASDCPI